MTCQTPEEYIWQRFKDHINPLDVSNVAQWMGAGAVNAAGNLAMKAGAPTAYNFFSGVKAGVVEVGLGAGDGWTSSVIGVAVGAGMGIALGAALTPGVASAAAIFAAGAVSSAAVQAIYEESYARQNPGTTACPYDDEGSAPGAAPDNPGTPGDPGAPDWPNGPNDASNPGSPGGPGSPGPGQPGGPGTGSPNGPSFTPPGGGPLSDPQDPLIIDLNGGGFDLKSAASSTAYFDLNGDGFKEKVGWMHSGTGMIVRDINNNGNVDGAGELLGNADQDALTALAALDENSDNKITSADSAFAQLRIWQDADGDGETDTGELTTLSSAGIVSLSTVSTASGATVDGNIIINTSVATKSDASTLAIGSAALETNLLLSKWEPPPGYERDEDTYFLPDLRGYGDVKDLSAAMTLDGDLKASVEDLVLNSRGVSTAAFKAAFEEILQVWAGADGVTPGSRGAYADAKHLAVVEAFYGTAFVAHANTVLETNEPGIQHVARIESAYNDLLNVEMLRFASQVAPYDYMQTEDDGAFTDNPLFLLLSSLMYDVETDGFAGNIIPLFHGIRAFALEPDADAFTFISNALDMIKGAVPAYFSHDTATYNAAVIEAFADNDALQAFVQGMLDDNFGKSLGTSGADTITATFDPDVIAGGAGDDSLAGSGGNDLYAYSRGDGDDIIEELGSRGTLDRLLLVNIDPADVTIVRVGNDVTLQIAESASGAGDGGEITIIDGLEDYFDRGVEEIVLGDGTVWTRADLREMVFESGATSGADSIVGLLDNDTLAGLGGNDTLDGGDGSDVFVYTRGDGYDRIVEQVGNGAADRVVLHNVAKSTVSFTRDGSDVKLIIGESSLGAGDGGSITLVSGFDEYFERGVEEVAFDDATVWARSDLRSKLLTQAGTSGADSIVGTNVADEIGGRAGNDTLDGGTGNDTYVYERGDGNDVVTDGGSSGSADKLVLHGVTTSQTGFARSGGDVILTIAESSPGAGDSGSVKLTYGFGDYAEYGIEQVAFDDTTVWNRTDLRAHYFDYLSTSGADSINGFYAADTITGGHGNDTIAGAEFNDVYVYTRGDGNDVITDGGSSGATDKLVLHNVSTSQVGFARSGGDVTLTIAETSPGAGDNGSVKLTYGFGDYAEYGVEQVAFDDATVWNRADLRSHYFDYLSTSGADSIQGFYSADTISGDHGNDTLAGAELNDVYVYENGDGNDVITEYLAEGAQDKLILHNVGLNRISFTTSGDNETLVIGESSVGAGDSGAILLTYRANQYAERSVEQIILDGGSGNETLIGGKIADVFTGGSGADVFYIRSVNDSSISARDLVTDFVQGTDIINLSAIDADTGTGGDQAFTWIGTAAYSNIAGQLRYVTSPSGARTIYGDDDGDGTDDFAIQITGSVNFVASDFVL